MPDPAYANREIDEKFDRMYDRFDGVETVLGRIEEQTKKTNGRVTKLEQWRYYVIGFCGACALIASFIS